MLMNILFTVLIINVWFIVENDKNKDVIVYYEEIETTYLMNKFGLQEHGKRIKKNSRPASPRE